MNIMLIAHTPEPEKIVAAAARCCYSNVGSINLLMDDHEVAIYGDDEHTGGRITWKTRKGNTTIDTKRLRAERPDIYEQYKREGKPCRIFRFC